MRHNNRNNRKHSGFREIRTKYEYEGKPIGDNNVDDRISIKALKDLPHSSYSIKADPYEAGLPHSTPYPIINRFNRVLGGNYGGEDNIDGGNVQQYASSTTSNFLKSFDEMRVKIGVNYRYLPMVPQSTSKYPGYQLIEEMRKSIAESLSILQSTTFTQMAINNFVVETDLPMGSATPKTISGKSVYTNTTDVLYAMSIYYQTVLQNALSVMNWHNSFRLKQGTAIRNAWDREVANLNSFFGLMNKSSFLSMLNSINLSFEGEYVDKDFMEQINLMTLIPSRRSNSMTDPILELQVGFNHPTKFKVYFLGSDGNLVSTTPLFDDADLNATVLIDGQLKKVGFWEACDNLRDHLSLEATQKWARDNYAPAALTATDNKRYNDIKSYFDVLIASFTIFKPAWADFREAFDVMTRTGTISWTKGFRPSVVKETDVALFWNVTIDHIYQLIFSGSHNLLYDEQTKRWRTFSLWNMYSGIPSYDTKNGGAFLTFSCKDMTGLTTAEQYEYLPLLFNPYSTSSGIKCVALSRDGIEAVISQYSSNIQQNVVMNRLAPLISQANLKIRIPSVSFADNSHTEEGQTVANLTTGHYSNLYKTLCQVFGSCRIQTTSGGTYDNALDPDVLAIYQIEITDVTNIAITYARSNAPFRGTTSKAGLLGFSSVSNK